MPRKVTYITVRYRLTGEIYYQPCDIDIPLNLDQDDQTLSDHCHNVMATRFRNKLVAFFIYRKRYSKRCKKDV